MNEWVRVTMIVEAQDAVLARSLAVGLAGDVNAQMFTTGLSPTGAAPATHFVSSGAIHEEFAALLGDAQATYDASGGQVPLATISGLYTRSVFSEIDPFALFASLGLQLVNEP